MSVYTKRAREIFAPTDASGALRSVSNAETQVWGSEVERGIDGAAAGRVDAASWADLSGITGDRVGQPAIVYGPDAGTHTDPVTGQPVSNEGIYAWSASPAGWRRVGDVQSELVHAVNSGAGSPDNVQATVAGNFNQNPYASLITVNFRAANTGAMTLSINGEAPRPLVTNTGAPIPSAYVEDGMSALVQIDEAGNYRLFSYGDSDAAAQAAEAAQQAAEAAQAAAEAARDAALAAVPNAFPPNLPSLKALPDTVTAAYLTEDMQRGQFLRRAADFSSYVASGRYDEIIVKTDDTSASAAAMVRADFDWRSTNRNLHLSWFGYRPDDSTDNTVAINKAIAIANEAGNTNIIVPVGIGRAGQCDRIIKPGVRFVGEGAAGQSALRGTHGTSMLIWGNPSEPIVSGGGLDGIGFLGTSQVNQSLVRLENAQEFFLNNPVVGEGVAGLVTSGASGVYSGMLVIDNLTGRVPNLAAPLIRLVNGSGFFMEGGCVYNQAVQGGAIGGRDLVQAVGGGWNTCSIKGVFAFLFEHALQAYMASGQQFGDVMLTDNYFDEMNEAILLYAEAGGGVANVDIHYNEMTGKRGNGIRMAGAGTFLRISEHGNVIRETKKAGISHEAPVGALSIIGNSVSQTNEIMSFVGSISGTTMTVTERLGHPGGTIQIGDEIEGPGVTPGTVVTSVPADNAVIGMFGVNLSQTVSSAALATKTGHYSSLYMATGSDEVIIGLNSFGPKSSSLGTGYGQYGVKIDGGSNFTVYGNRAEGVEARWSVANLNDSESTDFEFSYAPTLSDSGGGSFTGSASASYTRVGNRIRGSLTGNITSADTATGFIRFTLPKTAAAAAVASGMKGGVQCAVAIEAASTFGEISTYNGGATANSTGAFTASFDYLI